MPVKDSPETTQRALRALKGQPVTIWNDNSTPENTQLLHTLADELQFECIDVSSLTDHPSPNYLLLLCMMQERALVQREHLIIVESDVIVAEETITQLVETAQKETIGMVAAVTTEEHGNINFPYEYAHKYAKGKIETKKRLSFCCTLMSLNMLEHVDFKALNPDKNWYDVTISKLSRKKGFANILLTDTPVQHNPHSSRPWKQLKYTHPLRYYFSKWLYGKDRI